MFGENFRNAFNRAILEREGVEISRGTGVVLPGRRTIKDLLMR